MFSTNMDMMPNGDDEAVPYTREDRRLIRETHDSVIKLDTVVSTSIEPSIRDLEGRHRETEHDVQKLKRDVSEAKGGISVLRWGLGALIALGTLLIGAIGVGVV